VWTLNCDVFSHLADNTNVMRLNDRIFGGASRYFWDNEELQPVAGSQSWFGEFQPVNHPDLAFISALLVLFRAVYLLPL
jgi:hypothetical protein